MKVDASCPSSPVHIVVDGDGDRLMAMDRASCIYGTEWEIMKTWDGLAVNSPQSDRRLFRWLGHSLPQFDNGHCRRTP